MSYYAINTSKHLKHFGVLGMKWGIRRYQPYSVTGPRISGEQGVEIGEAALYDHSPCKARRVRNKSGDMPMDEYLFAKKLYNENKEINLSQKTKERIYEELDNHLSREEKKRAIVSDEIGDYIYTAINLGHNQYKIIHSERIDKRANVDPIINEVLKEVIGDNWEDYDE